MKELFYFIFSFVVITSTYFFLLGLPVWVMLFLPTHLDGAGMFITMIAWGFIVFLIGDSIIKRKK